MCYKIYEAVVWKAGVRRNARVYQEEGNPTDSFKQKWHHITLCGAFNLRGTRRLAHRRVPMYRTLPGLRPSL
ncbi:hypothetical protein UPYG_G00224120 [Umbra pygmaea]|uniref:Uncharacterized protein n=1 Tax=Umbra pygmaea TaxID=75934 RepID=A0ABD0WC56_UMBPY